MFKANSTYMLRLQRPINDLSRQMLLFIARRLLPSSVMVIATTIITSVYSLFQSLGFLETMRML